MQSIILVVTRNQHFTTCISYLNIKIGGIVLFGCDCEKHHYYFSRSFRLSAIECLWATCYWKACCNNTASACRSECWLFLAWPADLCFVATTDAVKGSRQRNKAPLSAITWDLNLVYFPIFFCTLCFCRYLNTIWSHDTSFISLLLHIRRNNTFI